MKIKPLHNKIVIQVCDNEVNESGIILVTKEKPDILKGLILAIGPQVTDAKVADFVMFYKDAGYTIKDGDDTFIIMKETELLGIEDL